MIGFVSRKLGELKIIFLASSSQKIITCTFS